MRQFTTFNVVNKAENLTPIVSPAPPAAEAPPRAPRSLLYSTSARIGGSGLDSVAHQSLMASQEAGFLARAIAYDSHQNDIPSSRIRSLRWHPVRLLSFLDSPNYYGAKKHYVDWIASRELATGRYDLFHSWSGDCVRALRTARRMGIPSLMEIPTWHRNKGRSIPVRTKLEMQQARAPWRERVLNSMLISRQHHLEEYELADILLVLSECAIETFLAAGIPRERLFKLERGVDADRFRPAPSHPATFRAIFVGALIERKGVHHLLEAWNRLRLPDAELLLVGTVHDEIKPHLEKYADDSVKVAGFSRNVEELYRQSCIQIFPSTCEGSAKSVYEAASCGLAQITTRESGDVVVHGENGLIVQPGDVDGLTEAIRTLHGDRDRVVRMGRAGRERILAQFTWDHFRKRLLRAYGVALTRGGSH